MAKRRVVRDDLGDRMKGYEQAESGRRVMPLLPVCARIDGKSFSRWTRGLQRPYDEGLSALMQETTRQLVEQTGAVIGYTQSDEISLLFYSADAKAQIFFDGKVQKMVSVLASMTTAIFRKQCVTHLPRKVNDIALFDCRVWAVPSKVEAVNTLLWREVDATKNSVSMAARAHYTHQQLNGKTRVEMMDMLMDIGVNWNDFPSSFKRGSYFQRRIIRRAISDEARSRIPEDHRPSDGHVVERVRVVRIDMPPMQKLANRVAVVFEGAEPVTSFVDTSHGTDLETSSPHNQSPP